MNARSTTVLFTFGTERRANDEGDTVHLRSGVPANRALHLTGPASQAEWERATDSAHEALGLQGKLPAYVRDAFVWVRAG